jgi:hypothetical protein
VCVQSWCHFQQIFSKRITFQFIDFWSSNDHVFCHLFTILRMVSLSQYSAQTTAWATRIRLPARSKEFPFCHRVQTAPEDHSVSSVAYTYKFSFIWQRTLEADSCLSCHGVTRLLCNQNFYYSIHRKPPLFCIPYQMHAVHTTTPFFKINFNIIHSDTARRLKYCIYLCSR